MKIHLLGIGGTFMGGLAQLALAAGHEVTGSDANVYPPMSEQLDALGIAIGEGYAADTIPDGVDQVIIGNALSRGNPAVEHILDAGIAYTSGPQWLAEHILHGRQVIAVAGTHGKTTTSAILAWILQANGKKPGFLIGGVAENFGVSANAGESDLFVIEADEYDSAFFDKRSKFVHYRPDCLIINNIEFDHADIFRDLDSILTQFHHLVRTVPGNGRIIINSGMDTCHSLLTMGNWSRVIGFAENDADWSLTPDSADYSRFTIQRQGEGVAQVEWELLGVHNALNALAAIIAASDAGVDPAAAAQSLQQFKSVKRRLQKLDVVSGIHIYDDFAHHPTAIRLTLQALRSHISDGRIIVALEPRSNTMKMGVHKAALADSLAVADQVCLYEPPGLGWDFAEAMTALGDKCMIYNSVTDIITALQTSVRAGDHLVIMSNGGFDNIQQRLPDALQSG
ncbi:MAG: UDP-N-acetylmuramate:L-alanyl-gamma-D-glutamyl-meso-diaminopimelate ligase [Gammaproteobacteria bacterium]